MSFESIDWNDKEEHRYRIPHGPNEPCTCEGCWACDGHVMGCTCDVDWDALYERNSGR